MLLAPYTTLKVGGFARYFADITDEPSLVDALAFAAALRLPVYVLGEGSNTLVSDQGFPGLVIRMQNRGMRVVEKSDTVLVTVAAGESFDEVVAYTTRQEWWGLENLSHIPGSMGAFPIQNVGAYGVEAKDVIVSVRAYNPSSATFIELQNDACEFAYRDSIFKQARGSRYIVTEVTLALSTAPRPRLSYGTLSELAAPHSPESIRAAVIAIRSGKFPDWNVLGTAGSFFKNPIVTREKAQALRAKYPDIPTYSYTDALEKIALGYVLDHICNLKGVRSGNVGLYEAQALVLVAYAGATEREVTQFAEYVCRQVRDAIAVDIEQEVRRCE